jgi:hypothetical protein
MLKYTRCKVVAINKSNIGNIVIEVENFLVKIQRYVSNIELFTLHAGDIVIQIYSNIILNFGSKISILGVCIHIIIVKQSHISLKFKKNVIFLFRCTTVPSVAGASYVSRPQDHTKYITISRTLLDCDPYMTTHNTQNRQTSTRPAGFEPANPANERPKTHALDRAATGIDRSTSY